MRPYYERDGVVIYHIPLDVINCRHGEEKARTKARV